MKYIVHEEIKARLKDSGLTLRDLANELDEPPGTIGNRLNGFIPLRPEHKFKINELIKSKINTALNK